MLRDIKINKTQFIAIFLMAFLGIFAYCGIYGEYYGWYRLQMHIMPKPTWLTAGFTILVLMILPLIR